MMNVSFDRAMMHQKLYFVMAMIIFLCTLRLSGPQCFIKSVLTQSWLIRKSVTGPWFMKSSFNSLWSLWWFLMKLFLHQKVFLWPIMKFVMILHETLPSSGILPLTHHKVCDASSWNSSCGRASLQQHVRVIQCTVLSRCFCLWRELLHLRLDERRKRELWSLSCVR